MDWKIFDFYILGSIDFFKSLLSILLISLEYHLAFACDLDRFSFNFIVLSPSTILIIGKFKYTIEYLGVYR